MDLQYVPLLQLQRDLYRIPRGSERFRSYLATMIDPETSDLRIPIVAMNPMAKDHLPALLDDLLAQDSDGTAAATLVDAAARVSDVGGSYKVTLVVADDAKGGWTNRYAAEFSHRFESKAMLKRGWLTGILWSSEPADLQKVRDEVLTAVFRAAYILAHGFAKSLGEMLAQEGYAMAMARCTSPALDPDDVAYTREVLQPLLAAEDPPTLMSCLFGDPAAESLGYAPQGLSHRAGLALALHDAAPA